MSEYLPSALDIYYRLWFIRILTIGSGALEYLLSALVYQNVYYLVFQQQDILY
ncbi:hypothetical protein PAXRUDRAFT_21861 [Paxillus rubicundulus Ve08.2h10]|uniref:Uncharacterized protein n=1 Tax=Paxillus rubicundulus Ve08.2h10 TaxID=930991 RepID=A0A0D0CP16_9AGAM|nr:hypothetical protein PAXRUDRAFT_21861 [Paxillus rubicundulus Ve08.2h10]